MNTMKDIVKLLCVAWFVSVSLIGRSDATEPMEERDETVQKEQHLVRSMMKLVLLENVETVEGIKAAQDAYLHDHYKGYECCGGCMYGIISGLYIQGIPVRNKKGPVELVFFDMTDLYRKLEKSKDETTRTKVRQLMARHGSTE